MASHEPRASRPQAVLLSQPAAAAGDPRQSGQRDRSHQSPINIDRASTQSLHYAGLFQRTAGKARQDHGLAGSDVFEHAQDLHLEFLDLVAGKHGLADAPLAGLHFFQRKDGHLGKRIGCQNEDDDET